MMTASFYLLLIMLCIGLGIFIYELIFKNKNSKKPLFPEQNYPPAPCKENNHEWQFHAWDIDYDVYKCKKCKQTKQTKHYQ